MLRDEIIGQTDLVDAVQEALQRKGIINNIKSNIRSEIFHILEDKTVTVPDKPRDVYIVSELIREFLMSFKLNNTNSVFMEEFGQPKDIIIDREFISNELGLQINDNDCNNNSKMPLLVLLVQHLSKLKEQTLINNNNNSMIVEDDSVIVSDNNNNNNEV